MKSTSLISPSQLAAMLDCSREVAERLMLPKSQGGTEMIPSMNLARRGEKRMLRTTYASVMGFIASFENHKSLQTDDNISGDGDLKLYQGSYSQYQKEKQKKAA